MLIIPANSSATSDYGNFSDGFRKAFHHEPISYTRRKDREFVELLRPRLSTVLSGTPRQISALIPDAENGLFSRFIFYYINFKLEWLDVFARIDGSTLDEIFDDIGWSFAHVYQDLEGMPEMEFRFTLAQQQAFNDYYTSLQAELHSLFGDDIIASARGWTCYTSRGQTAGDRLADCLYQAAALWLPGHKLRKDYSDGDPDWESDFYILKNTLCGAALTENLFHDNSDDCLFLESDEGRRAIVALHVEGIVNYVLRR